MNRDQIARQVEYLLRAATWPDTNLVFASPSVIVTLGVYQKALTETRLPLCLIRPGAVSIDPDFAGERADSVKIEFAMAIVVASQNDQFGEAALLGANRGAGSAGRGLLEVEALAVGTLVQKGPASGVPIIFRHASQAQPTVMAELGYIVVGDYRFEAQGTVAATYQKPSKFTAAAPGGGAISLAWNAATRFDFRRVILRRAEGSTPPANAAAGSGVTLGGSPDGATAVAVTDTPGAGTYSYSLFAVYDDTASGTDVATSPAATIVGFVAT